MRSCATWAYRFTFLLLLVPVGCSGLTFGPVVEKQVIIVKAGTPIEIMDQVKVRGYVLRDTAPAESIVEMDIGGWIAMPPDHWEAVKREIKKLRLEGK